MALAKASITPADAKTRKAIEDDADIRLQRIRAYFGDNIEYGKMLAANLAEDIQILTEVMQIEDEALRRDLANQIAGRIQTEALTLCVVMYRTSSHANPYMEMADRMEIASVVNESMLGLFEHYMTQAIETVPKDKLEAYTERSLQFFELLISAKGANGPN